uniref:Uncharacterized protein n=1 Tax=Romanomermis culicivorax TaxID=13658 RepID=A0A915HDL9_ROMCU
MPLVSTNSKPAIDSQPPARDDSIRRQS